MTAPKTPRHNLLHAVEAADAPRRRFMRGVLAGAGAVAAAPLAAVLPGCGGGERGGDDAVAVTFGHGVASGDPLADRVVLWTRVTPQAVTPPAQMEVTCEVATNAAFTVGLRAWEVRTSAAQDWTVKLDATGLTAATAYWYRFRVGGVTSPVGRTRTTPGMQDSVARVKLAVFSCANYPAGYFNAYAHAAQVGDLDAAVHLGDYIYEYGRDGYASEQAAALGREVQPAGETLTLADYRARYAQYRSDADLQALHAAVPLIAVWDDHEIANDAWREGAANHQTDTEGAFSARKAAALQAYHEWLPTRVADPARIYRSFVYGNLVALHMLDTRLAGRDAQLDFMAFQTEAGFDAEAFATALADPGRQLLGAEQTAWLQGALAQSPARWQMLGQQVLMGRMNIPVPIITEFNAPGTGVTFGAYAALLMKAQQDPASLTPEEQAILAQPAIPYNLDAWDGYAVARETVLGMARALDKDLIVLSGDTHNAWANNLQDAEGHAVGVEFATPGVTSPGMEAYLPEEDPASVAASLPLMIPTLAWCDTQRRGYMVVTATATECRADWVMVDGIGVREPSGTTVQSLKTLPGPTGRVLVAV